MTYDDRLGIWRDAEHGALGTVAQLESRLRVHDAERGIRDAAWIEGREQLTEKLVGAHGALAFVRRRLYGAENKPL